MPEHQPLPSDHVEEFRKGLQTRSGKYEFIPETLQGINDPDRPPLNKYMPTYESAERDERLAAYPLQLMTSHTRYPFHVTGDGRDSTLRDIKDHRVLVDGHHYLVARLNSVDAEQRAIKDDDLVRLWNNRGSVVCAAQVTDRVRPGVVHTYQASAEYKPVGEPGKSTDLGGCVNMLTSKKPQSKQTSSMAPNGALIQVEKWTGTDDWRPSEAE